MQHDKTKHPLVPANPRAHAHISADAIMRLPKTGVGKMQKLTKVLVCQVKSGMSLVLVKKDKVGNKVLGNMENITTCKFVPLLKASLSQHVCHALTVQGVT